MNNLQNIFFTCHVFSFSCSGVLKNLYYASEIVLLLLAQQDFVSQIPFPIGFFFFAQIWKAKRYGLAQL
jgi:hypothetical protein